MVQTTGRITRTGIVWGDSGDAGNSNAGASTSDSRNRNATGQGQTRQLTDAGQLRYAHSQRLNSSYDGVAANRTNRNTNGGGSNGGSGSNAASGENAFTVAARRRAEYADAAADIAAAQSTSRTENARVAAVSNAELDASWHSQQADLNVWEADQAITDGNNRRGRDVAALTRGRRNVGGGGFSAAATGRGRTVLGSAVTGGLDAANRAAAKKTKSDAIGAQYLAQQGVISRTAAAADAAADADAATATTQANQRFSNQSTIQG